MGPGRVRADGRGGNRGRDRLRRTQPGRRGSGRVGAPARPVDGGPRPAPPRPRGRPGRRELRALAGRAARANHSPAPPGRARPPSRLARRPIGSGRPAPRRHQPADGDLRDGGGGQRDGGRGGGVDDREGGLGAPGRRGAHPRRVVGQSHGAAGGSGRGRTRRLGVRRPGRAGCPRAALGALLGEAQRRHARAGRARRRPAGGGRARAHPARAPRRGARPRERRWAAADGPRRGRLCHEHRTARRPGGDRALLS